MTTCDQPFHPQWIWDSPPEVMLTEYRQPDQRAMMIVIDFFEQGFAVLTQEAASKLAVRLACEIEAASRLEPQSALASGSKASGR